MCAVCVARDCADGGVCVLGYRLEVWPGFVTSIAQYENSIMLMADISHKILRMDTVLDIMYDIHRSRQQDFHGSCEKRLIGEIVLTR